MRSFNLADNLYYHLDTEDPNFKLLERFNVVLYYKTCNGTSADEARKEMFSKKNRTLENIPPTQVNVSNPKLLVVPTRKITDMKI